MSRRSVADFGPADINAFGPLDKMEQPALTPPPAAARGQASDSPYMPHGNLLGSIPPGMGTDYTQDQDDGGNNARDETATALDNLFGEHPASSSSAALPIDPVLASPPPATLSNPPPPPPAETNGDSASPGNAPAKRKATSRANMLARGGACEFCKRRKLKCTAEQPTCAACARAGRECVYSQKKQRSRVRVLEDRLMELERRLDHQNGGEDEPRETESADEGMRQEASAEWDRLYGGEEDAAALPSFGLGDVLLDGSAGAVGSAKAGEPDLMTLADAAAADGSGDEPGSAYPWEGMSAEKIGRELIRAVEGQKGVGEKIIAHLMQLYIGPPSVPFLHGCVPPSTLLSRLSASATLPSPHPTLILALLPHLLPLSPSSSLSSPHAITTLTALLQTASRTHTATAMASANPRIMDVIAASALRALTSYHSAKFLEGYTDSTAGAGLAWAAGLGKLGGAGEQFVMQGIGAGGGMDIHWGPRERKLKEREGRIRALWGKTQVGEPARSAQEFGERVLLFWNIYLNDKASSIGWHQPSTFHDDDITTPFPLEDYTTPVALRDRTTLVDLYAGRANTGQEDTDFCAQIKALAFYYSANRLYDQHPALAGPERAALLEQAISNYAATLRIVQYEHSAEMAGRWTGLNQAWMGLHASLMLCHARLALDEAEGSEQETALLTKALSQAEKVVDCLEKVYAGGDAELRGYDINSPVYLQGVGKFMYKLARRTEVEGDGPRDAELAKRCRAVGREMTKACQTIGKRMPFAQVMSQMLENMSMGTDHKIGEYERPDNVF